MKLYQRISSLLDARQRCNSNGNQEWFDRHTATIAKLVEENLPSGAGFDTGTTILWGKSTPEHLVFQTSFHHMNDNGFYTHWTEHEVHVTPSLQHGFNLRITGRGVRGDGGAFKDYVYVTFGEALDQDISWLTGRKTG